jgi:endonuclease YncB( thermonuclease family)
MSLMRALLAALVAVSLSCGGAEKPSRGKAYKAELRQRFKSFEQPGLTIGDFPLATEKAILDGDTIKVEGLGASLRLLGVDTEETFKHDKERRAYAAGWERYKAEVRGDSSRPVKFATPIGDEAKHFAEDFFKDADSVHLERDHPKEIRDFFDRYLAYVFIDKNGKRLNYNVEVVRAGYSPYFTKYGQSRRFHAEFLAAEAEARAAKRGIWDPKKEHYDDYEERKPWWDARGQFIHDFEQEAEGKENYIILTNWDAMKRLEEHIGKEVVILGGIGKIYPGGPGPARVMLSRRRGQDFSVIFFDRDVFGSTGIEGATGEYAAVKGIVARYENKKRGTYELQIVVNLPGQILGWSKP